MNYYHLICNKDFNEQKQFESIHFNQLDNPAFEESKFSLKSFFCEFSFLPEANTQT